MNISIGFQIEAPDVLVPWNISEKELNVLLGSHELRKVTNGYYVLPCKSLGGLSHHLGFHFTPRDDGRVCEFELFRPEVPIEISYRDFQDHLELCFGPSLSTSSGTEGYPSHLWKIQDVQISHTVQEHFGPAEYLRFKQTGQLAHQ
jgi:hypothetical protein